RPGLPAVARLEQRGVLDAGIDGVGIARRGLQMPDPRELPRMRRAVIPLVRARRALVAELVADRLPGPAAVVRALDQLPEPRRGLRRVQPVRVGRRTGDVVDLPATEVRPGHVPVASLAVRAEDESAF